MIIWRGKQIDLLSDDELAEAYTEQAAIIEQGLRTPSSVQAAANITRACVALQVLLAEDTVRRISRLIARTLPEVTDANI